MKLSKYLNQEEQEAVMAKGPAFIEELKNHLSNPLYKDANFDYQRTQLKQIIKGAETYPTPLNINDWSPLQLIDHANQEIVDTQHYLTGLKEHFERMEQEINRLKSDVIYWRDKYNVQVVKNAAFKADINIEGK